MTSQAVMKRYLTSVAKNNEEYKDNKTIQDIASLISNYKKLDAEDKEVLDAKIEIAYNKLQAKGVSASKSSSKATTTRKAKSSTDGGLKGILADLKKKLGAEKFKDATRGTDIKKDIQIPALKKGKRIVRKKGYTTNQYGKFKNKIGTAYWESRANRYDANQPSQTRKYKLADGGEVEKIQVGDYVIVKNNPYWEGGLGSEKSYRRKVKMISGEGKDKDFFFTDGSNSSSKYVHSIKKHAKGGELEEKGNLNRWSNSGLDEIIKRHEVITEQVRFAFAKVLGLDRAYALLLNDNVGVSPYSLVERAVSSDLLLIDEIDKNLINSAIEQSEDSRRYSESGEGIGSSDITYMLKYMLDGAGLKTDFVKNTLQRVDNNGNVIQLKNELPKTTMFAKGGKVKNAIDILMTEEPKVWDKFGFNSGSEIRASKDKTKQYAQELEKVLTAKGVKKGSLTKKINEDLTDENYHLLNEFLTRNGYFNSKLTNDLLKSYNNPVYSGAYADKEAITIEEKAKPKTSGAKKIQLKKLSEKTTYVPKREIESIELESGETLSKNDIIDGVYRAKKKFAKGGKTSEEYAVSGILSENDEIEIISKHKTFASALVKMNKMWDEGKLDKYLEVRVRPILKSLEYAKGGEVFGAEKFWNELSSKEKMEWLKKRRDIPSDYKSSLSRDSFEKLPDWIKSKVKKAFADNKIYKYGQGGTTKRIKRKGC